MNVPPWLIVIGDLTPLGGMDRANHALALYLARREGAEVHLVAHRAWHDLTALPNVRLHRIARPGGRDMLGLPLLARAGRARARQLAARGARVVVNGGNCRWGDVNWVHYVHAAWGPRQDGGVLRRVKAFAFHRWALRSERACLREARVVIANSERTRADLLERLDLRPERAHTVYYGNDPEEFRPPDAAERAAARARLGWTDDRPALAFVGALGDLRKGFDTLYDAWRRVSREPGWDGRLVVAGAGRSLAGWKARAAAEGERAIEFLGFRQDVPAVLRACDGLVSPTRYEAYGLNVQEALACGLPALVSRSAGVAERYPAALEDLLIPDPDDAADLAARLLRWREGVGKPRAALSAFSERLRDATWDQMAERLTRLATDPDHDVR